MCAIEVAKLLDLSGEVALVTGSTGGVGAGIARRLAEAGASVVVHDRDDRAGALSILEELCGTGGEHIEVQGDITQADSVADMFDKIGEAMSLPSIVVNNAGVQPVIGLDQMTVDDWALVHDVNLKGTFNVTQEAARCMRAEGVSGSIVNIASIEGLNPARGHVHYATSKAGVIMFTRASALELGEFGIRVNSVSPGLIDRPGLREGWPEGVEKWETSAPLGRLGQPDDIGDAVLFLASPAARWISGANIVVDGGVSANSCW